MIMNVERQMVWIFPKAQLYQFFLVLYRYENKHLSLLMPSFY